MKKLCLLAVLFSFISIQSCKKTSTEAIVPTLEVQDLNINTTQYQKENALLGKIEASISDNSTLKYSIILQTAFDAVKVNEETGEIRVNDKNAFLYQNNPLIEVRLRVSNGKVEKESLVNINIQKPKAFKFTWKALLAKEMALDALTEQYDYNYTIEWGDGTFDENVTGDISHQYKEYKAYQVSIIGICPALSFKKNARLTSIDQWGSSPWQTMQSMFEGCRNLISVPTKDAPDLSQCTDMSYAFKNCTKFSTDLNHWDVSNIQNMHSTFGYSRNFNGNLSNWDVSNVKVMEQMFAACSKFNADISRWDVSNVENMSYIFALCGSFNRDLSQWKTNKAKNCKCFAAGSVIRGVPLFANCDVACKD